MTKRSLILAIALAIIAIGVVYATQRPTHIEALPAAEGPIPQIVIVAPRVTDEQR